VQIGWPPSPAAGYAEGWADAHVGRRACLRACGSAAAPLEGWREGGPVPSTTTIQIQGRDYTISDDDVRRVARAHAPGPLVGYYVEIDSRRYPPTQLIRHATGTRDRFNSANARSALTRLGFIVRVVR
jgi:hypothetical protein